MNQRPPVRLDLSHKKQLYFDTRCPTDTPFVPHRLALEVWGPRFSTDFNPPFFVIVYIAEGSLVWQDCGAGGEITAKKDTGEKRRMEAGDALLYGPGTGPCIWNESGTNVSIWTLFFYRGDRRPAYDFLDTALPLLVSAGDPSAPEGLFEWTAECSGSGGDSRTSAAGHVTAALIDTLFQSSAPPAGRQTAGFVKYTEAKTEAVRNLTEIHTAEELAERCGVSPSYLSRLFRAYDRETPYSWLRRKRMEYAASRLLEDCQKISAVSSQLGFTDQYAFSKAFKQVFSVPPSEYRGGRFEKNAG